MSNPFLRNHSHQSFCMSLLNTIPPQHLLVTCVPFTCMTIGVWSNHQILPPGTHTLPLCLTYSKIPLSILTGIQFVGHTHNLQHYPSISSFKLLSLSDTSAPQHCSHILPSNVPLCHFFSYLHHGRTAWIHLQCSWSRFLFCLLHTHNIQYALSFSRSYDGVNCLCICCICEYVVQFKKYTYQQSKDIFK